MPNETVARTSAAVAEHDEGGVVVAAPLELVESLGRGEGGACRLLDDDQRGRREPAAGAGRGQRRFGQAAAGGRVEKGERERLDRMRRAEIACIAAENAGDAAQAQRRHVLAQQGARLGAVVDEQRKGGAARERLEPERAGAGEEIEHARAGDRIAVGVDEDVEQRLAQPVGGRPDRLRLRRRKRAAAQASADDAHQCRSPRTRRRRRRFSRTASSPWPMRSGSARGRLRLSSRRAGGRGGAAGASRCPIGPEKSDPAKEMSRSPSCSRKARVFTSAISPGARSASWNGPNDTRISRLTSSPRWPSTFFTSRFLPSRIAKVSQTLLPWARSTVASIEP